MAIIKESSKVTLYSGVDITEGLQIVFQTRANQERYFESKVFSTPVSRANFSYLRRTGKIKVGIGVADASKCDYLSFINPAFENKRFYAKIVNYEYVNNNTTEITYDLDRFQTFMFDVIYGYGFIEKEHLSEAGYQKSVENPWRRDVYELNTAEDFKVSKEMEEIYQGGRLYDLIGSDYNKGFANYPEHILEGNSYSCMVLQIADFDTSGFTDIETKFYNFFDMIINSSGVIIRDIYSETVPGRPEAVPVQIGRGYGMYQINGTGKNSLKKFSDALNWLTFHGLDGQIIGAFQIDDSAWDAYIYQGVRSSSFFINPRVYNVHNKKLLRFPYQYVRVYNNEGDCKEYKFEMWNTQKKVDGSFTVDAGFRYAALFDGPPMVSLIPYGYKRASLNQEERIDCHQIPQIGYTTDAYLSFLASQYNMNIAKRTDSIVEDLNSLIDSRAAKSANTNGYGVSTDFMSGARNQMEAMVSMIDNLSSANISGALNNYMSISPYSAREEASIWKSGGNYVYSGYFAPAEAAYVADKYNAGSTNGTLGYYLKGETNGTYSDDTYGPGTFTIERVKLLDDYLAVFDTYMNGYGHNSGRYGKPRICAYMTDNTDSASPDHVPHFAPYFGKMVTYVKTTGMHVYHTIADVSSAIEEMFNTGIQFLKGEDFLNE